jgi:hypothetical protein
LSFGGISCSDSLAAARFEAAFVAHIVHARGQRSKFERDYKVVVSWCFELGELDEPAAFLRTWLFQVATHDPDQIVHSLFG